MHKAFMVVVSCFRCKHFQILNHENLQNVEKTLANVSENLIKCLNW